MFASSLFGRSFPAFALITGLAGCAGQTGTGAFVPQGNGLAQMPVETPAL